MSFSTWRRLRDQAHNKKARSWVFSVLESCRFSNTWLYTIDWFSARHAMATRIYFHLEHTNTMWTSINGWAKQRDSILRSDYSHCATVGFLHIGTGCSQCTCCRSSWNTNICASWGYREQEFIHKCRFRRCARRDDGSAQPWICGMDLLFYEALTQRQGGGRDDVVVWQKLDNDFVSVHYLIVLW